jgi:hypothetical protein
VQMGIGPICAERFSWFITRGGLDKAPHQW